MTARTDLTPRELVVLKLLADRRSPREIADLFGISRVTGERQVKKVVEKLGACDVREAVAKAISEGIIGPLAPQRP